MVAIQKDRGRITLHHSGARPTKYRGDLAAGSIEKVYAAEPNAWLPVSWRDDLIPYHSDDVRRVALAVLCDFGVDDRTALLLHSLFVHYWNLDHLDTDGNAWTVRTGHIDKWVDKKLRKLIPTPQYIAPPQVWEAIERLKLEPLPAIHDPNIVGVKRAPKKPKQRRPKEAV